MQKPMIESLFALLRAVIIIAFAMKEFHLIIYLAALRLYSLGSIT